MFSLRRNDDDDDVYCYVRAASPAIEEMPVDESVSHAYVQFGSGGIKEDAIALPPLAGSDGIKPLPPVSHAGASRGGPSRFMTRTNKVSPSVEN